MKTIAVDMDGVLADWELSFYEEMSAAHPDCPLVKPLDRRGPFHAQKQVPDGWKSKSTFVIHRKGFYSDLRPIDGAIEAMHFLAETQDVFILTAPMNSHATCHSEKAEWVRKNLGKEWMKRVVLTNDKTRVHADLLIDDRLDITGARTPSWEHVLFDAPYSQDVPHARRMRGWSDLEVLGLDG